MLESKDKLNTSPIYLRFNDVLREKEDYLDRLRDQRNEEVRVQEDKELTFKPNL